MDISKIKPPPPPNFGDDNVGRIATYMHANRMIAGTDRSVLKSIRRSNREIGSARKKTQKAWDKMVPSLIADRSLLRVLKDKNLLSPLQEVAEIIAEGHARIPDDGTPAFEPHTLVAIWAADIFFPGWESSPPTELARTMNDALQRTGFDGGDKTGSIRSSLNQERKNRIYARKAKLLNWPPPKL